MSKVIVGRPINGISINGLEWLMDDEDKVLIFDSEDAAKEYLRGHGFTDADFEEVVFKHSIGTCFRCGEPLFPSQIEGYTSHCFTCDEDFYSFEQEHEGIEEQKVPKCIGITRYAFAKMLFDSKGTDESLTIYSEFDKESNDASYAYEFKVIQFANSTMVIGNYWGGGSPFVDDIGDDTDSSGLEELLNAWMDSLNFGETVWVEYRLWPSE